MAQWAALQATGLQARLDVFVNGAPVGTLTPLAPALWLGPVGTGDTLTVTVTRSWGEATGDLTLLTGEGITAGSLDRQDTAVLAAARDQVAYAPAEGVVVPPGGAAWVRLGPGLEATAGDNAVVRMTGHGLLVTALQGPVNLGRLWLGDMIPGARLAGGRGDILLVPAGNPAPVDLLVECTGTTPGVLSSVTVGGPVDSQP